MAYWLFQVSTSLAKANLRDFRFLVPRSGPVRFQTCYYELGRSRGRSQGPYVSRNLRASAKLRLLTSASARLGYKALYYPGPTEKCTGH